MCSKPLTFNDLYKGQGDGKCVITNWKAEAREELIEMGIGGSAQSKRAKNTVTVYANRLCPID